MTAATQRMRLPVVPGPDATVRMPRPPDPGVTAVMPRPVTVRDRTLVEAELTDLEGRPLCRAWVPSGARLVSRGARVFMHHSGRQWRQVPVVPLGENGRPL